MVQGVVARCLNVKYMLVGAGRTNTWVHRDSTREVEGEREGALITSVHMHTINTIRAGTRYSGVLPSEPN